MIKFKNKKLAAIIGIIFILLFIVAAIWYFRNKNNLIGADILRINNIENIGVNKNLLITPEFLTKEEKEKLGVSSELKIQSLKRNSSGQVMVYKIIKSDNEVIYDLSQIN